MYLLLEIESGSKVLYVAAVAARVAQRLYNRVILTFDNYGDASERPYTRSRTEFNLILPERGLQLVTGTIKRGRVRDYKRL